MSVDVKQEMLRDVKVLTFTCWFDRAPAAKFGTDAGVVALKHVVRVAIVTNHVLVGG